MRDSYPASVLRVGREYVARDCHGAQPARLRVARLGAYHVTSADGAFVPTALIEPDDEALAELALL